MPGKNSLTLPDIRFVSRAPLRTARERKEMLTRLRRIVASAGVAVADRPLSATTLEPLIGSRSGARAFKLTPYFGPGRRAKGPPVVMKIAPRAQSLGEKANYEMCRTLPKNSECERWTMQ